MTTTGPIKIGYGMSLTGPLGANGQTAFLAQRIWEEDVNRRGGLLGRPVQLVCVDDKSDASLVRGIYEKLLDVEKVDLVHRRRDESKNPGGGALANSRERVRGLGEAQGKKLVHRLLAQRGQSPQAIDSISTAVH